MRIVHWYPDRSIKVGPMLQAHEAEFHVEEMLGKRMIFAEIKMSLRRGEVFYPVNNKDGALIGFIPDGSFTVASGVVSFDVFGESGSSAKVELFRGDK